MPRNITLGTLRARCLQQHDLDVDASFTGANVGIANAMISAQYSQLYACVADSGCRYFETVATYAAPGTQGGLLTQISDDFLGVVDSIERLLDATVFRTRRLKPLQPQERSRWSGKQGSARRYEVVNKAIYLYPTPPVGEQYMLRYVPQAPDLTTSIDSSTVDMVNQAGEDFMIWGSGVRFLGRVKSDASLAMAERERARKDLEEWARLQAFHSSPRRMVDDDDDGDPDFDGWY